MFFLDTYIVVFVSLSIEDLEVEAKLSSVYINSERIGDCYAFAMPLLVFWDSYTLCLFVTFFYTFFTV
jgi:hypothetical protein